MQGGGERGDVAGGRIRVRLSVHGIVQGVGFRPFVYGLATRYGLAGWARNDSEGVFIEVEGPEGAVEAFRSALEAEAPPLARIERIEAQRLPVRGEEGFRIAASRKRAEESTPVSPDIAVCEDCLREMRDPGNRRYRYPFLNCTNCGPRFTITRDIPYDRARTTMAAFAMCPDCRREYEDPRDRRFHAQPIACPACGPSVWFAEASEPGRVAARGDEAIALARERLARGEIIAVRGIGGFHLACRAGDEAAVAELRRRKRRTEKPFAVMARDVAVVRRFAEVSEAERRLLESRERPIVLLRRRRGAEADRLACPLVAPGNPNAGVLLPYSPLHYLLLGEEPLVMTSANLSEEPIVKDNEEAVVRLAGLCDGYLFHDRGIEAHCDDSVVRVFQGRELPIRRSRGYAPFPVLLAQEAPPVLAVGGELKATFCVTKGRRAYLSQHIGDMENLETWEAFERAVAHFLRLYRVEPERVTCDLHPGYLSTESARRYAEARNAPLVKVQHHHAHAAALLAEHGKDPDEEILAFVFDGTGYGTDGAIWGGEALLASARGFTRLAHLAYVPLPGGDAAIRRPYRTALAFLQAAEIPWDTGLAPAAACPEAESRVLARQIETGVNCVPASSMGRLFDAVASLAGVRQRVNYEAQAAMELEALALEAAREKGYEFAIREGEPVVFDAAPVIRVIVEDLRRGAAAEAIAARFHAGVAGMIAELAERFAKRTGVRTVGLTGGVFQNVVLLELAVARLGERGFTVLTHQKVPPNDGGICLGQAVVAAWVLNHF